MPSTHSPAKCLRIKNCRLLALSATFCDEQAGIEKYRLASSGRKFDLPQAPAFSAGIAPDAVQPTVQVPFQHHVNSSRTLLGIFSGIGGRSAHLCVGFLFLVLYPVVGFLLLRAPLATHNLSHTPLCHAPLCHTQLGHIQLSYATFSYRSLSHTTLSHIIFHAQLCHSTLSHTASSHTTRPTHTQFCHAQIAHNFVTLNVVTHTHTELFLSHTHTFTLSHTHPPNFLVTQNFVTHYLSHNFAAQNFVTHTNLSHTRNFVTLGLVARLGPRWSPGAPLHFARQRRGTR